MAVFISPNKLSELHQTNEAVELIDVRTPAEYREAHVPFARNIPLERLDPKTYVAARSGRFNQALYVICRNGNRSKQACDRLSAEGLTVIDVEGGIAAWDAAGLPITRGKKGMSLERQARIAIGLTILASTLLAAFVHPYWIGLTAFMGGGLIFSGIADFCGFSIIFSRMPWNQVPRDAAAAR